MIASNISTQNHTWSELHIQTSLLIFDLVSQIGNVDELDNTPIEQIPLLQKIIHSVTEYKKLVFVLPAFPAKSANRNKSYSALPDMGEFLALKSLQSMCSEIAKIYSPGAEILICSDGRVFNDLVMVSDEDLLAYKSEIKQIIKEEGFSHLKTFSLDDCYDHGDFVKMRTDLVADFGDSIEVIREKVKSDEQFRQLFNGIHRFLKEDLTYLRADLSKNQLMKVSKSLTYQVIQRSGAWDGILNKHFSTTLRLSIHPYPQNHRKYGVKLVGAEDRWATPWHNVTVRVNGQYMLAKRVEAEAMGAKLNFWKDRYAFYEL